MNDEPSVIHPNPLDRSLDPAKDIVPKGVYGISDWFGDPDRSFVSDIDNHKHRCSSSKPSTVDRSIFFEILEEEPTLQENQGTFQGIDVPDLIILVSVVVSRNIVQNHLKKPKSEINGDGIALKIFSVDHLEGDP